MYVAKVMLNHIVEDLHNHILCERKSFIKLLLRYIPELVSIGCDGGAESKGKLFSLKIANLILAQHEYRNGYLKLLSNPFFMVLDPSNACQLHCHGCIHSKTVSDMKWWNNNILDIETAKVVMDRYAPYSFGISLYNWGEPFLNKNVYHIIKYARGFCTNVSLSSNVSVPIDADALVQSGLTFMICSIDGATQNVYEQYRRGGRLEQVKENIIAIRKAKDKYNTTNPMVVWQFLTFEHNIHELELAKSLAEEWGADNFLIANPFSVQWDDSSIKEIRTEQAGFHSFKNNDYMRRRISEMDLTWENVNKESVEKEFVKFTKRLENFDLSKYPDQKSPVYCNWLYSSIVVDACGVFFPCCSMFDDSVVEKATLGKVNLASIDEIDIYNSPAYQDVRLNKIWFSGCENCGSRRNVIFNTAHIAKIMKQSNIYHILTPESIEKLTDWSV